MGSFGVPLPAGRWSLQGKNALVTVDIGYKILSQIKTSLVLLDFFFPSFEQELSTNNI
jgi:hypothetical protein